ncbi:DUF445 domain-containing protein [Desulforamulus ruminis]|uniref:DUF445 family protein n=1 Tax=Desulforamulus ruminis (strain ATCC 23193 / DSM 2154 / NCIMB 8452 / DL) TaxID=696281 RepID=F6DNZ0_DESRL|nr:DUF445 family protein [Desulforamulus ruminis]AEG60709.1 protein of unknown function DUF445 [Desulforamulus ruminis DSM 2154]
MDWWAALSIPVISAFIGWITNLIAVKAIFKPYEPLRIPGLPWGIQGVVPKRRAELAKSIGEIVEQELVKVDDLLQQMKSPEILDRITHSANESIRCMIIERIPSWVPNTVRGVILEMMGDMLDKQMPQVVRQIMEESGGGALGEKIKLAQLVEERLNAYDIKQIEALILKVASRELKHIELLGGVLGFIIGLVQVAIVYLST